VIDWPAPDPTSPYFCHGSTLLSFSGGRTSAYLLWQVLCAHGGVLPDYVYVVFANTGKERPETLRFVYECGLRWGVRIWWVEWRAGAGHATADRFQIVSFDMASRNGEPLTALFRRKSYLPNAVTRFCTAEAKIETMKQFMLSLGYTRWINMVGLRADERHRVLKQVLRNLSGKECWRSSCPLAMAGVIKRHVNRFWLGRNVHGRDRRFPLPQGFDLGLLDHEGNCDECMLKGFHVLAHHEREQPGVLDWWIDREAELGAQFVTEYSYAEIKAYAHSAAVLPGIDDIPIPDCNGGEECGVGSSEEVDDGTFAWLLDQLRKAANDPIPLPKPSAARAPAIGDLFEMVA
jgi:3'-phosphoadenosine 5'-phosphosulfate sulfotransferase (PAPS reductase)/FAD synthetase